MTSFTGRKFPVMLADHPSSSRKAAKMSFSSTRTREQIMPIFIWLFSLDDPGPWCEP